MEKELNSISVYQRLIEARNDLQKMELKKTGFNPFGKFNYFQLDDFIPTVNQIFLEKGLLSRFYIVDDVAYLEIIATDSAEKVVFTSPVADGGIKGASPIQNLGGIHTYMRRYLWIEAMEIVEHDTIDTLSPEQKVQKEYITPEQIVKINEMYTPEEISKMLGRKKVKQIDKLTKEDGQKIIDYRLINNNDATF